MTKNPLTTNRNGTLTELELSASSNDQIINPKSRKEIYCNFGVTKDTLKLNKTLASWALHKSELNLTAGRGKSSSESHKKSVPTSHLEDTVS